MQRTFRETFILIGAPAALALAVLMVGTAMAQPAPRLDAPEQWPVSACHTTTVTEVGGSGAGGAALLCTADDAVRPSVYASGLTPGRAYNVWMLVIADQTRCRAGSCANDTGSEAAGLLRRLGGSVAQADGTVHIRAHLGGLSFASGGEVTLLLTSDRAGRAVAAGTAPLEMLWPRPSSPIASPAMSQTDVNAESVVGVARLRLPEAETAPGH